MRRPMLRQRWRDVSFIHWACSPEIVGGVLPEVWTWTRWRGRRIGLTPLMIERSRPELTPVVPGLSSFPETNLRTYVIGPDGRDGVWFFSLEADSPSTVITARSLLGVPYRWADMTVQRTPQLYRYQSWRRRSSARIGHHISVRPGGSLAGDDLTLADWLTGRWRAWSSIAGRLVAYQWGTSRGR